MNLLSYAVLIGLLGAWGWVLGRPLLQNLFNSSRRDPVGHFHRQLSVLGQAPQQSLAHGGRSSFGASFQAQSAKRRRLQVFLGFMMAAAVSLVLAVIWRGVFIWQHLLIDVMFAVYVYYAARAGALETERSLKVTNLHAVPTHRPTYLRAVGDR